MTIRVHSYKAVNQYLSEVPEPTRYFANTAFANIENASIGQRGSHYENIGEIILTRRGNLVEPRINSQHDRIVNNEKTEFKGALSSCGSNAPECIFNHIGLDKDWSTIWFLCCTPQNRIFMARHNRHTLATLGVLRHQQGGSNSRNDDYMIQKGDSPRVFDPDYALESFVVKVA